MRQETNRQKPSGLRARLQEAHGDTRGVALQTVIIIVVMLAIAGAVAAVLFSRADEVTGQLQNADVTANQIDTPAECSRYTMGSGPPISGAPTSTQCTWAETGIAGPALPQKVTMTACGRVNGTFTPQVIPNSSYTAKCVVNF